MPYRPSPMDKQYNVLGSSVNYGHKKSYSMAPRVNVIKLFRVNKWVATVF